MATSGASNTDRVLTSIRGRADHLRYTIGRLEHNLLWNPAMTWPELLGQFIVISKQLDNIYEEIPDMIQHFVCAPKESTPNAMDIPLLLRTREDPEMEEHDAELLSNRNSPYQEKEWEALKRLIEDHNELCETAEEQYKKKSDQLLKQLKINKYNTAAAPKPTRNSSYKFMETGHYV